MEDETPEPGGEAINTADSLSKIRGLAFTSSWLGWIATKGAATTPCVAEKSAATATTVLGEHESAGLCLLESCLLESL
jgi:hypothetical protein